ncbi:hypothetical protein TWF694_003686 [Orbilia ellipsospora]|uniref:F-box domain-containing protein n=1 Tax=Orbilia ellipsospora TaxID=2528407 RepID=A0AAV9X038_9PEZI
MKGINILPTEIHEYILGYLSFDDQISASLVCKRWQDILLLPIFRRERYYDCRHNENEEGRFSWKVHRAFFPSMVLNRCVCLDYPKLKKDTILVFNYQLAETNGSFPTRQIDLLRCPFLNEPLFYLPPTNDSSIGTTRSPETGQGSIATTSAENITSELGLDFRVNASIISRSLLTGSVPSIHVPRNITVKMFLKKMWDEVRAVRFLRQARMESGPSRTIIYVKIDIGKAEEERGFLASVKCQTRGDVMMFTDDGRCGIFCMKDVFGENERTA